MSLISAEIDVSGKSYDADEWVRTQFPVFEAMLINEEAQVNGYVMLIDCSGMTLQMQKFFGLERMTRNKDTNVRFLEFTLYIPKLDRRQSKTLLAIDERRSKSQETMFLNVICCENFVSKYFDLPSSVVFTFSIATYLVQLRYLNLHLHQYFVYSSNEWSSQSNSKLKVFKSKKRLIKPVS